MSKNPDRPKTNSITHLVKIVAEEAARAAVERAVLEHIQPVKNVLKLANIRISELELKQGGRRHRRRT